jgi:cyclase
MDVARVDGAFRIFAKGGRENTGIDALEWAQRGEANGAGELVVNSIDTDGVREGFDLELLEAIGKRVSIPIIASGGAGKKEDFKKLSRWNASTRGLQPEYSIQRSCLSAT